MICPHCEKEMENGGIELSEEECPFTRADVLPLLLFVWLAFNAIAGFCGAVFGSMEHPSPYMSATEYHEAAKDQCDAYFVYRNFSLLHQLQLRR